MRTSVAIVTAFFAAILGCAALADATAAPPDIEGVNLRGKERRRAQGDIGEDAKDNGGGKDKGQGKDSEDEKKKGGKEDAEKKGGKDDNKKSGDGGKDKDKGGGKDKDKDSGDTGASETVISPVSRCHTKQGAMPVAGASCAFKCKNTDCTLADGVTPGCSGQYGAQTLCLSGCANVGGLPVQCSGFAPSTPAPQVPATPAPTPAPQVSATPAPTPAPQVPATPSPTPAPQVPATPAPTPAPQVPATPAPTPAPQVPATPAPTPAPQVPATPAPTPAPATPSPTPAPVMAATPAPNSSMPEMGMTPPPVLTANWTNVTDAAEGGMSHNDTNTTEMGGGMGMTQEEEEPLVIASLERGATSGGAVARQVGGLVVAAAVSGIAVFGSLNF